MCCVICSIHTLLSVASSVYIVMKQGDAIMKDSLQQLLPVFSLLHNFPLELQSTIYVYNSAETELQYSQKFCG